MPLNFIPNQPYLFENALAAQSCLNNDDSAYAQLVQPNDNICIQVQMEPCTIAADIQCEPAMYAITDVTLGAWTVSNGWSSGGTQDLDYDGTSGVVGQAYQSWGGGEIVAGRVYRINFTIDNVTGNASVTVALGLDAGTATEVYDALGTYTVYRIAQDATDALEFIMNAAATTAGDVMSITDIEIIQYTSCWYDELNFGTNSWTYTFDSTNLQGKFCSLDVTGGDLVNNSAYTTDGNYHRVSITITDSTVGYLEVIIGGVYIGNTDGNGTFYLYGTPTDTSGDLILRKQDNFDGCVSYVTVDDFGTFAGGGETYKMYLATTLGVPVSDEFLGTPYDDRLIFCFNMADLESGGLELELECGQYKWALEDNCSVATHLTTTNINYDPAGWDCTYVQVGYSAGYAFGFYFGSTTAPAFTLTQRLRFLQFAPRYPAQGEEYLFSDGTYSRSWAQSGKIRQAWYDYVDEACHDVIRLQLLSDVLTVGGQMYFCPVKDYEPEWDEHRRNLAQSRTDLIKVTEETLFNRSC